MTAMQELHEKVSGIIQDNSTNNSQWHKGFRHGMGMVKEAIEELLLEKEKQQIIDAYISGDGDAYNDNSQVAIDYFNETYP